MNSFTIALGNFKRNVKVYGLYIMSMIFSVLVYYNFIALKYNPDFQRANSSTFYIKSMSSVVSYLLLLFVIFFIWFSSSFFLNQRKKEIGIYAFMGVTNSEIAMIYSIELIFIGFTAITMGLLLGVIFCKLFLMMLAKAAILNMKIRFFISYKALVEAAGTFFIIFFVNSVLGYINIVRSKLIDLFNASKREESYPKINYLKGLLSLIALGFGYYFARSSAGNKFITNAPLAIGCVVVGTYWFFGAAYSMVMRILIKRKRILYNGVNIVSMSNIAFRIKNNYRTLAAVSILAAITLTSYGTVASLKYFVQIRDSIQTPYSISYISGDNAVKQMVSSKLKGAGKKVLLQESIKFITVKPHIEAEAKFFGEDSETAVVRYSDFVRISRELKSKEKDKIKNEKLNHGEALYLQTPTVVMSLISYKGESAKVNENTYTIKNTYKTPLFGNGMPLDCLIVSDGDYEMLKGKTEEHEFNGLRINNTDNIKALHQDFEDITEIKDTLFVNNGKDLSSYSTFGIIYFLGAFLALVFIIATGSIIYFKLVSEAYIDKDKFRILRRLGMTDEEAYRAVSKQIGISYLLPLVVGIIHSCVAMSVLSDLMNYNIIVPAIMSIIIFAAVYGIYFIATTRKYLKLVM